jgi:hypothetical protein
MTDPEGQARVQIEEIRAKAERDTHGWAGALRLLFVLQAALADGTPAQRTRLRKRMGPLIEQLRDDGDTRPLYRLVREVHGPGWRPTGEAAEWIAHLGLNGGER